MADLTGMMQAAAGQGGEETDEYFQNTVLLLHGDGSNGQQNNVFLDSSSNAFSITRNGNTTQGTFSPFSKPDGSWGNFFDGTGDYLSNTSTALITAAVSTFTVETWVYLTANPPADANGISAMCSLDGQPTGPSNYMSFGPMDDRTLRLFWFDGAAKNASGSAVVALNTWTHIACVVNAGSIQFYVNGVADSMGGTTTLTNRSGTQGNFSIGSSASGVVTGYLSNFRVTTTAVYTTGFTPSTTPLTNIANTKILTCQSNRFVDNSTNAYALTANGNVAVTPFSPFPLTVEYAPTLNGGAGYFDGSGDYLSVPDGSWITLGTNDFTAEAWIYNTVSTGANQYICGQGNAAGTASSVSFEMYLTSSRTLSGGIYVGSQKYATSSGTIPLNTWTHVALVRDGGNVRLYINGVQDGVDTTAGASSVVDQSSQFSLARGGEYNGLYFNGFISGFRFINGTCLYPSGTIFTVPTSPPTAVTNTQLLTNFTNSGILDNTCFNALETVGNAQVDTTTKKYGTGSMEFDGTGDYLIAPPDTTKYYAIASGSWTLELWLYLRTSDLRALVSCGPANAGGINRGWAIATHQASDIVYFQSVGADNTYSSVTMPLNDWFHLAFVFNGTNLVLYIDGVNVGSKTPSLANPSAASGDRLIIGGNYSVSNVTDALIDDFRFTQGIARYTTAFTPPTQAFPNIGE